MVISHGMSPNNGDRNPEKSAKNDNAHKDGHMGRRSIDRIASGVA
jgi:hypothetical protein